MRRENLLFESYIKRNEQRQQDDYEGIRDTKKKGKHRTGKRRLTDEEKYEIATSESDALKRNID